MSPGGVFEFTNMRKLYDATTSPNALSSYVAVNSPLLSGLTISDDSTNLISTSLDERSQLPKASALKWS